MLTVHCVGVREYIPAPLSLSATALPHNAVSPNKPNSMAIWKTRLSGNISLCGYRFNCRSEFSWSTVHALKTVNSHRLSFCKHPHLNAKIIFSKKKIFHPIPTSNLRSLSVSPGPQTAAILSNPIISVKCIHLHPGSTATPKLTPHNFSNTGLRHLLLVMNWSCLVQSDCTLTCEIVTLQIADGTDLALSKYWLLASSFVKLRA